MLGVIILHYNNPLAGGAFSYVPSGSINEWILYWLESVFICAVDVFVLISGYFMCASTKRNLWKPIELITQVIIFNEGFYIMSILRGHELSVKTFLSSLVPANYFVILYCVTYCVSPYITVAMEHLNEKNLKRMMAILILLFSVYPTAVDVLEAVVGHSFVGLNSVGMYGDQWGYSIVNFLLLWTIGAYLRQSELMITNARCVALFGLLSLGIMLFAKVMLSTGATLEMAFSYCNPFIITEAAIVFMLFQNMRFGSIRIVNTLSKGAFTVYLVHGIFLNHIGVEEAVSGNVIEMFLHIVVSVTGIYMMCWMVYCVYEKVMHPIWALLKRKVLLPQTGI